MATTLSVDDVLSAIPGGAAGGAAFFELPRVLSPVDAPGAAARVAMGPELRALVAAHHRAGQRVVVVTARAEDSASLVAAADADEVLLLPADGRQEEVLRAYAAEQGIDLEASHLYAGRLDSLPLLLSVGHPWPTQPDGELTKAAERAAWPVLRLQSRARPGAESVLRTAAAYATLLPSMLGGVAVGALKRDRQQIVQQGIGTWVDLLFGLTGVTVHVIGEENLWAQRPAVFVYNHRNNFDPYVAIRLVRRDWGAVGKKELAGPLTPLAQWLTPNVAYVDRSSSEKAIASLIPVTQLLREGVSVLIAPEGTRSRTGQLGPFKKGPFQMARAAGVPVVPIVIRNADAVAGRSAGVIRRGTVDVAVLPPVVVDGDDAALEAAVEQVRRAFEATLQDWPSAATASQVSA